MSFPGHRAGWRTDRNLEGQAGSVQKRDGKQMASKERQVVRKRGVLANSFEKLTFIVE